MALTQEDLQAIGALMDNKLEPINARLDGIDNRLDGIDCQLDAMQEDITQIKEDTEITRETVNTISEWTEAAADVLKIKYPIK